METKYQNNRVLIGGAALVALGSSRSTSDTDYLVSDSSQKSAFLHDTENNVDYLNAAGNRFFAEIWKTEAGKEMASPQALFELKAYAFVQHCQNFNWAKTEDAEYDLKFLVRNYGVKAGNIVKKYVSSGEYYEIQKIIDSVRM